MPNTQQFIGVTCGVKKSMPWFRIAAVAGALLAFLTSLGLTAHILHTTKVAAEAKGRRQFDVATGRIVATVTNRLNDYALLLRGGAGLMAASPMLTREQWRHYVDTLKVPEPGLRRIGLIKLFPQREKEARLTNGRDRAIATPSVWPEGERDQYSCLQDMEPHTASQPLAFTFEGSADSTACAPLEQARDTGVMTMSGMVKPIELFATEDPFDLRLYLPVYRPGATLISIEARRAALIGYVTATFRINVLMRDVLSRQQDPNGLGVDIYDGTVARDEALLYRRALSLVNQQPTSGTTLVDTSTQFMADRPWTFRFVAPLGLMANIGQHQLLIIQVSGLVISVLIGIVVLVLIVNLVQAAEARRQLRADIVRLQNAEERLRASEARFRILFANNPLPMWAWDTKTLQFIEVNNAAIDKYGYSRTEFEAMRITDIRPPEDVPVLLNSITTRSRSGLHTVERRHRLREGRIIDVQIIAHDIELEDRPAALIVANDITENNKARAALLESEQMARGILEAALDGFVQLNADGVVVEFNPQAEVIFGWSREQALGMRFEDLLAVKDERIRYREAFARFTTSGDGQGPGVRLEVDARRRDGRAFKVEVTVTWLRRREGYLFNCFVRDLTEKIAAEEQHRHAQKLDAIGHLTGGIAHDFNNILTVINSTIDILADGVADNAKLAAVARMIIDASERGAALTQHLLAFARKQPLRPREIDVNTLIANTANLLRPALGEQIELDSTLEPSIWPALVDSSQLSTSLLNLAVNARDAMPEGGRLILETANVVLDRYYASRNPGVRPGPYVMIRVTDTGIGIPAGVRDKVFEPFFTTKEVGKGSGLGLSMVYGFVRQSGGHINLDSREGHGTSITIYLPRADEARAGEPVPMTALFNRFAVSERASVALPG
jgi:PAS domain S-box-containing protein